LRELLDLAQSTMHEHHDSDLTQTS
jgi:glutamate dehydrogenase